MNNTPESISAETLDDAKSVVSLQAEIDQLKTQNAQLLRQLADAQNAERRVKEEYPKLRQAAVADVIGGVATNLNELQMGLQNDPESDIAKTAEGLLAGLEKEGVVAINPAAGDALDPEKHEVLAAATEGEPGTVAQVLAPGWEYNGKVITPAKVSAVPNA